MYYISVDEKVDKIFFIKEQKDFFSIVPNEYNNLNCSTYFFGAKNQDIILFPSNLEHFVEKVTTDKPRISLSFNTFIKGELGGTNNSTYLKL